MLKNLRPGISLSILFKSKKVYLIHCCDTMEDALTWADSEYIITDDIIIDRKGIHPSFLNSKYYIISLRSSGIGLYYVDMVRCNRDKKLNLLC